MKEAFIAHIWFNRLFSERQVTLLGREVRIISTGMPNNDAGPDVFNAKITIDGRLWAGNVEFHLRASDWHRHHHDLDPAYSNIILHVVLRADEQIFANDLTPIPTIQLRYPAHIRESYDALTRGHILCDSTIGQVNGIRLTAWLERLLVERLEEKRDIISTILRATVNDWDQALYSLLARSLGTGVNSQAMQQLAAAVPLRHLKHHTDRPAQLRAMLLGTAGLLPRLGDCPEKQLYEREYQILRVKYNLPEPITTFRFARMRPANFPTHRVMQLADLVPSIPRVEALVRNDAINRELLAHATETEIINCYLPIIYSYADARHCPTLQAEVIDRLHSMVPESNFIVRHFAALGIRARDAAESQALYRLYRAYCEPRDCIRCRFAHLVLARKPEQDES